MGLIFFVVVTPIGLLMKALNKDLLNLKFNNHKSDFGLFPDAWSALEASLSRHNLRINILEVINRPGCNVWNIGENHVGYICYKLFWIG